MTGRLVLLLHSSMHCPTRVTTCTFGAANGPWRRPPVHPVEVQSRELPDPSDMPFLQERGTANASLCRGASHVLLLCRELHGRTCRYTCRLGGRACIQA